MTVGRDTTVSHGIFTIMIAYEDLVVALTNWRAAQGLPTTAVQFNDAQAGSVDLDLPVTESGPIVVEELPLEGDLLESTAFESELLVDEESHIGEESIVDEPFEPRQDSPYDDEQTSIAEDLDLQEDSGAEPSLDYNDDTQYSESPVGLSHPEEENGNLISEEISAESLENEVAIEVDGLEVEEIAIEADGLEVEEIAIEADGLEVEEIAIEADELPPTDFRDDEATMMGMGSDVNLAADANVGTAETFIAPDKNSDE